MTEPNASAAISCFNCGAELICGAKNGDATCWCYNLPSIMPLNENATSCYCWVCLEKELRKKRATDKPN